MTLRFVDSFDDRDTAHVADKYVRGTGTIGATGRNSTKGVTSPNLIKTFDSQQTWIIGFAIYWNGVIQHLLTLTDTDTQQIDFLVVGTGLIIARRNFTGGYTDLAVSSAAMVASAWNYLEFKVTIGNAGSIEVHLNEVEVMNANPVDCQTSANATANSFNLLSINSVIDDLYVCDSNGAMNNDFLGDNRIEAIFPNGEGTPATHEWDSSAGGDSVYTNVDDNPPNDDTDYNTQDGSSLPKKDVWAFPDIPSLAGVINGVQVNTLGKKTDAGGAVCQHVCRSGGNDYNGADFALTTDVYAVESTIWEQNPDGPADWVVATVNAAEFGYRRSA